MKNSILTIAFLLATGITFAQETPTTAIQKTKTKSNNTNERISIPTESILVVETPTKVIQKSKTKSNNTNERISNPQDSILVVGIKNSETRVESTIESQTSNKKHTKTGHVTLLK